MDIDMATVQSILQGSRNIDRMRVEISQIISMLIGMVDPHQRRLFLENDAPPQIASEVVEVEGKQCFWNILARNDEGCLGVRFVFDCNRVVYFFEGQWTNPKYVELVYSQLPKLLELFVRTFPSLVERLEPFIKASEVKF
ncbi:MAG TPA: hypothetical protein P5274_02965 [Candidatus Paceibacterota bacterium]|nr:hypothetical protein [Candidatus Paceibacterota bacterium]